MDDYMLCFLYPFIHTVGRGGEGRSCEQLERSHRNKEKKGKNKKNFSVYDTIATAQNGVYIYKEKNLNLENPYIYSLFTR